VITEKLEIQFNLNVSTFAVNKHLEGMLFTVKWVHKETKTANSEVNKRKWKELVQKIIDSHVVFIVENNFTLCTKREYGRSEKGESPFSRDPSSKGPNVHVIGAIPSHGVECWESRRGSYKKVNTADYVRLLLQQLAAKGIELYTVVLVVDNAPCHSDIDRILDEDEFNTARIIMLRPHSAPLNPIEAVWSIVKAKFKELHGERKAVKFQGTNSNNMTLMKYRLQYMEKVIDDSMTVTTKQQCDRCIRHVQRHYNRYFDLHDLEVGV